MGYLSIGRGEQEKYYLFITKPLEIGSYIEIVQGEIRQDPIKKFKQSHHNIKAPQSVIVLREEVVDKEYGGIENLIKGIKSKEIKYSEVKSRFEKCQRK